MEIPIAIIIFNRPNETHELLKSVLNAKPKKIYIISDGPRSVDEVCLVNKTRATVDTMLDGTGIQVFKIYSKHNMGCMKRVSSGLNVVFKKEEWAIILEDDCIPDSSFFEYCEYYLNYYKNNDRYMSICGTRFPATGVNEENLVSKYPICWGWATWARAWAHYDPNMEKVEDLEFNIFLKKLFGSTRASLYWKYILRNTQKGKINSWAYRWMLSCWSNDGLSIVPSVNLISNIGVGANATHTKSDSNPFLNREAKAIGTNKFVKLDSFINHAYDNWVEDNFYSKSFVRRIQWFMDKINEFFSKK